MLHVDTNLLMKYAQTGPRYTSYPTAPYLTPDIDSDAYIQGIKSSNHEKNISLYFHLPFCDTLCHFCGCNMLLTRSTQRIDMYIDYLAKEIELLTHHFSIKRKVNQLHWGGGTPNSLSPEQIRRLGKIIYDYFIIEKNAEVSVELDPRGLTFEHMQAFYDVGTFLGPRQQVFGAAAYDFESMVLEADEKVLDVQQAWLAAHERDHIHAERSPSPAQSP